MHVIPVKASYLEALTSFLTLTSGSSMLIFLLAAVSLAAVFVSHSGALTSLISFTSETSLNILMFSFPKYLYV